MHLRAAAASTPSGVPPMPKRMSVPAPGQPVAMAPATSPSVMRRMRAPVERTSAIRSSWRGRSRMTAVRSRTGRPSASERACEVLGGGAADVAGALGRGARRPASPCRRTGPGSNMVPRSATAMTARAPPRPRAVRVVPSMGSTAMSVSGGVPSPIFSPLKSIGALSFSPSPMTTIPSMGTLDEHGPHGLDGGAVGAELVAPAHPAAGRHGGRLGDPHELHGEVAVGGLAGRHHGH